MSLTIRERRPADLSDLVEVLAAQQSSSGYPHRWPLPFPVEEFLVRPGELGAWVALDDDSDEIVGHVAATAVDEGWMASHWRAVLEGPLSEIGEVSVLFVDHRRVGSGIGSALLDHAVEQIRRAGRTPVLDVVGEDTGAGQFYQRRGWTVVGYGRPQWLPDDRQDVAFMALRSERVIP